MTMCARAIWCATLAVATMALVGPAVASAAKPPPERYKVLVVTSTSDALREAGVASIRKAGQAAGFSVTAPSPADVGDQFTPSCS